MISDLPLVTIVTPSYNQAEFLEQTIQSVLRQDYPNIEYIVIDGGSTDGSNLIIKKFASQLALWVSEPDQGQSDAINKGFENSKGEILNWVNSDDLLEPSAVSIAVYFMLKYPQVGMVFGDRVYIDSKNNTIRTEVFPAFRSGDLIWGAYIPQETAFLRKEIFFKVGKLDIKLGTAMDTDLWFRINRVARIKHLPVILGRYREHAATKTSLVQKQANYESQRYLEQSQRVRYKYAGKFPSAFIRTWFLRFYKMRVPLEKRFSWHKHEIHQIRTIQKMGLVEAIQQNKLADFP
jgi:glycosyltransferase involved in cell wall biosynthesis